MLFYTIMDVYKFYTNTGKNVSRDSLLSDSDYKNTDTSWRSRLCSRLADSGNELRRKSRTFPRHCCARNNKFECYFDVLESNAPSNLMRVLILKAIFG